MLVNIFVAIILSSYDQVSKMNPDSNNASEFASMVIMQAKRTATRALGKQDRTQQSDDLEPHVLLNKMDRIEDETFWEVFEGYFTLGGHGVEAAMKEHASEVRATPRAVHLCALGLLTASLCFRSWAGWRPRGNRPWRGPRPRSWRSWWPT